MSRRKNDPSKDRKALETYVTLRGYKQGRPEKEKKTNMDSLTLDEIAKELNMSKTNLKRALRIERNLTDKLLCAQMHDILIHRCDYHLYLSKNPLISLTCLNVPFRVARWNY